MSSRFNLLTLKRLDIMKYNIKYKYLKFLSLLMTLFLGASLYGQTCDFSLSNSGNTGGYVESYLVLDAAGNIDQVVAGPGPVVITGQGLGTITEVMHFMYDPADPPTPIPAVGVDPSTITGGCTNNFMGSIIALECLCEEDEISATYTPGGGDVLVYYMADASGVILDSNMTGNFGTDEAVGDYFIYALSYDSTDPPSTIPAVGGNISDFSNDGCYNQDFLSSGCCAQKIVCCEEAMLAANDADALICAGTDAIFDFTGLPGQEVTFSVNGGAPMTATLDGAGEGSVTLNNVTTDQTITLISSYDPVADCTILIGDMVTVQTETCTPEITASDPCSCNDDQSENGAGDGTFSELITVEGIPGLDLCAASSSTGISNPSSPANGSGHFPFMETPIDAQTSSYAFSFDHIDAVGYTVDFVNCTTGAPITVELEDGSNATSISNTCYYPIIAFMVDLDNVCAGDAAPVTLDAMLTNDNPGGLGPFGGSFAYSGTGVTGNQFDPGVGAGIYTITAEFTPDNPVGTNIDANDAVCTTELDFDIVLNALPDATVTCPSGNVDLCGGLVDLSPSVPGGVWTGTAAANVSNDQLDPSGLFVGATYTLTYTVTDADGCDASSAECSFTIIRSCDANGGGF